jgi:hypothetical protein
MRCVIKEDEVITLREFYKGLNDDFRKEIRLIGAFTQQDYELLIKS